MERISCQEVSEYYENLCAEGLGFQEFNSSSFKAYVFISDITKAPLNVKFTSNLHISSTLLPCMIHIELSQVLIELTTFVRSDYQNLR